MGSGNHFHRRVNAVNGHTDKWITFTHCPSQPNSLKMNIDKTKMRSIVVEWRKNIKDEIPRKKIVYIDSLFKKFEFLIKGN